MVRRKLIAATAFCAISAAFAAKAQEAEVIHQWVAASESAGVRNIAEKFESLGGTWIDNAIAGGPNSRSTCVNRLLGGQPPSACLFNTGAQLLELKEAGLLRDLTEIAEADDWASRLPARPLASSTADGKLWALPISGNGANWFWWNQKMLDEFGVDAPETWDEVFAALDMAEEHGKIGFALSGEPRWERLLYNAVVLSVVGPEMYSTIIDDLDPTPTATPEYRAAVETFVKLRDYVDAGAPGRAWPDAVNLVMNGDALVTQGGTWFNGAFVAAGRTAGDDYNCSIITPDNGMILSGDVFVFPKLDDPEAEAGQDLLIQAMADTATQTALARDAGNIPIHAGADTSGLNPCIAKASAFFADPELGMGSDQAQLPPALIGAAQDAITQLWNDPNFDIDTFLEAYKDAFTSY